MAPRRPLTHVSDNTLPMSRRKAPGKPGTSKTGTGKTAKQMIVAQQENDALKAQIADLTSQLADAKIEPTKTENTTVTEKKNPFGGALPAPVSYPSVGVAPKRPLTAFQRFSRDNREELKETLPDATVQEINAKLGEMWKSASTDEHNRYNASVEQDRRRYAKGMEAFNQQKDKAATEKLALEYWTYENKQKKAMEFYEAHLAKMKETEKKSGPVAPKQARNAYHFFSSDQHKDFAKKNISLGEAAGHIAVAWNKLQNSRAKKAQTTINKYKQMALEDETRYEKELEEYQAQMNEISTKQAQEREEFRKAAMEAYAKKIQNEDDVKAYRRLQAENKEVAKQEKKKAREEKLAAKAAKADEPKRPRNAYSLFFGEHASAVSDYIKAHKVEHSMAKEIGDRWKALSTRQKNKYEKAAEGDRQRFESELEQYKAKKQTEMEA